MKRLLALLLLVVAPAFAQELTPIYDPVVEQTYTPSQTTTTSLQNINQTGGTALTLYDDGTTFEPILLPFEFYYFGSLFDTVYISQNGFISFTSNANGCCSGNELPFLSQDPYYNLNNSIFAMWSDLADMNAPGNPYYLVTENSFIVGWYGIDELGTANKFNFEISLFSDSSFSIAYGTFDYTASSGRTFTSGYQGDTSSEFYTVYYGNDPTVLENNTYMFTSSAIVLPPPPPPQFQYWNRVAGEYESFTLTEQAVVRYGAEGTYAYQTLEAGTYDCGNGLFGDPIGGVVKSCEVGSNEPPPIIAVDCTINPLDPTCVINDLIDFTDEQPVLVADTTNSTDTVEEDPASEELIADENSVVEESTTEESLEELLADDSGREDDVDEELVSEMKELTNEEKAETLADSISKDVLGAALSVAADVVSSTTVSGSSESSSSSSSSSRNATSVGGASELVADSNTSSSITTTETNQDSSSGGSENVAIDILETGRQLGQEAIAATMAATEASANDSMTEAQTIASTSSSESQTVTISNNETTTEISDSSVIDNINQSEQTTNSESEILVAEQVVIEQEVTSEIQTVDALVEQVVAVSETEQTTETNQVQEQPSAVEFTTVEETMEVFASNINQQAAAEQEELENNIVQQAIASSQTNEEENKMGFAEAEAVTIASDPALANAFNVQPNTASLELLGVLGSRAEEKSDAEVRAEQVVAANKEQQDAINANYMDADQSGIVAAIGADADVSSYLSQRLQDVPFYKPEDIYKGVIIKDNVRGSYFLEKGNTDTYKKMVEEQYK